MSARPIYLHNDTGTRYALIHSNPRIVVLRQLGTRNLLGLGRAWFDECWTLEDATDTDDLLDLARAVGVVADINATRTPRVDPPGTQPLTEFAAVRPMHPSARHLFTDHRLAALLAQWSAEDDARGGEER